MFAGFFLYLRCEKLENLIFPTKNLKIAKIGDKSKQLVTIELTE